MNTVRLILGNSLVKLQDLADCSVDYIVSDPPYELTSSNRTKPPATSDSLYGRHRVGVNGDNSPLPVESPLTTKRGFMGKEWDGSGIAFSVELWGQCLRVLKPNGVIKAFSGTRTFHRMTKAMREAGFVDFEVHAWIYGSGFPKSMDVSKALDKQSGAEREPAPGQHIKSKISVVNYGIEGRCVTCGKHKGGLITHCQCSKHSAPVTDVAKQWSGYGTALKPAWEPIVVARKPS